MFLVMIFRWRRILYDFAKPGGGIWRSNWNSVLPGQHSCHSHVPSWGRGNSASWLQRFKPSSYEVNNVCSELHRAWPAKIREPNRASPRAELQQLPHLWLRVFAHIICCLHYGYTVRPVFCTHFFGMRHFVNNFRICWRHFR